jgi:hypothetical protein
LSEIKIILDAFSQSSSLDESIKKLEKIIELSDKIKNNKDALKGGATSGNDTARLIAENAKLVESIDKIRTAEQKKQDTIKAEQGIVGSLKKEVRELNKAIDQSKNIKEVEQLNRKLTETKGKLNDVKNAGKEATNTFGNALSSFQFKFNALGQAVGQLAVSGLTQLASQAVDFAKESVKAFLEAELNAKKLEVALQNISGEGTGAFNKLIKQSEELQKISIFSDDDIQNAQTALVQYGLTSDEVEKLLPKILDLASAQGIDLASATDISIKAINGQTKGLKTAGIAFEDTGTKAGNLAKLTDNLNKFQGQSSAIMETNAGKLARLGNAYDDFKESVGEALIDIADQTIELGVETAAFLKLVFTGYIGFGEYMAGKTAREAAKTSKLVAEVNRKAFDSEVQYQTTRTEAQRKSEYDAYKRNNVDLLVQRKEFIASGDKDNLGRVNREIAYNQNIIKAIEKVNADFLLKKESDAVKTDEKIAKAEIEKTKDLAREIRAIKIEQEDEYLRASDKLKEDAANRIEDLKNDKSVKNEKQRAELILEINKKLSSDLIALNKKEQDEVQGLQDKAMDEATKKRQDDLDKAKKAKKEKDDKAHELGLEKLREEAEADNKLRDKEIAAREEFKKQTLQFGEDLLKELEKISDKKIALLDKEISSQDKNIDKQRELADKGLANTLAFEERKKAELERSKIAEQKKQEKIAKTQAFFNAFSSYSKDEPQTAAIKALKDVLLAEVVAKAFAKEGGIVGEIAEPVAGGRIDRGIFKGRSHSQGGIHLEAEGNEGIFSGKEMGNLGRENFYALKNLLKNPIDDAIFERQNDAFNASIPIINVINKSDQVVEKLDELKKVIADKKETVWNISPNGLISKEEFERGFKTITQYKKAKRRF